MRVSKEMVLRDIAGEHILVPVGKMALCVHGMLSLTESALLLWNRLQNDCTEEELVDAIMSEYDTDRETVSVDVRCFLDSLEKIGVLES